MYNDLGKSRDPSRRSRALYREAVMPQSPGLLQPWGKFNLFYPDRGCANRRNRVAVDSCLQVRLLHDLFPDSVHVRDVALKAANDPVVWKYAPSA